jgi:NAD(P)-dependent dehydrogenase (short-subunit alcohol dehydrogenase family)
VVITACNKEALDEAVELLGGPAHALAVDGKADDTDHQDDTIRQAIESVGSVDFLVNNTVINPTYCPIVDLDLDAARRVVRGELRGLPVLGAEGPRGVDEGARWRGRQRLLGHQRPAGAEHRLVRRHTKAMLNSITELLAVELSAPTFALTASRRPW